MYSTVSSPGQVSNTLSDERNDRSAFVTACRASFANPRKELSRSLARRSPHSKQYEPSNVRPQLTHASGALAAITGSESTSDGWVGACVSTMVLGWRDPADHHCE